MPRRLTALLALAVLAGLFAAAPAEASSPLQFGRIYYDSPGSDTRTNASLNAEWAIVKNVTGSTRCLTGWTVRDAAVPAHVYKFGTFCLGAYKYVYLHTGHGTNTASHRYWNSGSYIWNNPGDHAYLRTSAGTLTDSCGWSSIGSGYTNC